MTELITVEFSFGSRAVNFISSLRLLSFVLNNWKRVINSSGREIEN